MCPHRAHWHKEVCCVRQMEIGCRAFGSGHWCLRSCPCKESCPNSASHLSQNLWDCPWVWSLKSTCYPLVIISSTICCGLLGTHGKYPKAFHCYCSSSDNGTWHIMQWGVAALLAKLDIADAFKQTLVCPENWLLLGSTWETEQPDGPVCREYYFYCPLICTALWCHSASIPFVPTTLLLTWWFKPVQTSVLWLTPRWWPLQLWLLITNFLGIDIDSIRQQAYIKPECWHSNWALGCSPHTWCNQVGHSFPVWQASFICHVCHCRWAFLWWMIDTSKMVSMVHHAIKPIEEFCHDVTCWPSYLPT